MGCMLQNHSYIVKIDEFVFVPPVYHFSIRDVFVRACLYSVVVCLLDPSK